MKYQKGISLIEIIVVIAILAIIMSFGTVVSFGSFLSNTFLSEEEKIISVLERARSQAMANVFESTFGVCYDSSTDNYVIFKGGSCTLVGSELIPANSSIAENSGTTFPFPTVVFDRLTGNTTGVSIHMSDGVKTADIIINNEGTINW